MEQWSNGVMRALWRDELCESATCNRRPHRSPALHSRARGFALRDLLVVIAISGLLAAGFIYVSGVLCRRANPFRANSGGYGDFLTVLASGPVIYLLSGRHTLKSFADGVVPALRWNGLGCAVPFFLALHWDYLGRLTGLQFSITWRQLMGLTPGAAVVLALAILLVASLLTHQSWLAYRGRILLPYVSGFVGLIALVAAITWFHGDRYYLHIHHYCWGAFFIPFLRFQNPVSLVSLGIFAGVFVEGISRWGMDPVWIPKG